MPGADLRDRARGGLWQSRDGLAAAPSPSHPRGRRARRPSASSRDTPVEALAPVLADLDMVLVMSVEPGFSGQRYIEGSEATRGPGGARWHARRARAPLIQVDGGIGLATAPLVAAAGRRRAGVRQRRVRRRGPRARRAPRSPARPTRRANGRLPKRAGRKALLPRRAAHRGTSAHDGVRRRATTSTWTGPPRRRCAKRPPRAMAPFLVPGRVNVAAGSATRTRCTLPDAPRSPRSRTRVARSPATCVPPGAPTRSSSPRAPPRPTTRPCSACARGRRASAAAGREAPSPCRTSSRRPWSTTRCSRPCAAPRGARASA